MTDSQRTKCHAIIHTAAATCGAVGAGLAQIPLADAIPISAAQVTMVISLGEVFDMALTETAAKGIFAGVYATAWGQLLAKVFGYCLGWIPLVGNGINATIAATITEHVGWEIAEKFDREAEQQIDVGNIE